MRRLRSLDFVLLAIAGFFVATLAVLPRRVFDPDEFEHAHAAWCVFKGLVPYQDFFEHHTPWYYYALRPLFNWFAVDAAFDEARQFLIAGRVVSVVLTAVTVVLMLRAGRLWRARAHGQGQGQGQGQGDDRRLGLVASLLLLTQPVFFQKMVEIRPDVPAVAFVLGALVLLLRALEPGSSTARTHAGLAAAGLCLGGAIMCTQKALFVLPGAVAGLGLWVLRGGGRPQRSARAVSTLLFLLAVAVPGLLTWAWFAHRHDGGAFLANNFLLNARWKPVATHQLRKVLWTSAPVLALALAGALRSLSRVRAGQDRMTDLVLLCIAGGLFAGVLVMPSAHRQYYLLPLPIVCLFAADELWVLLDRFKRRGQRSFAVLATVALGVLPAYALQESFRQPNDHQLARLRTVLERTSPGDLVMDGWEGTGVFRPHALPHFFLHEEIRAMLTPQQRDAYLQALESGTIRPTLIALDVNLRALGPRFLRFVETRYVSGDGFFYFRRGDN
jgi:hypothetical protein